MPKCDFNKVVFATLDHIALLKKLEIYDKTDRNHGWFKRYLSNRRQFIQIDEKETQV